MLRTTHKTFSLFFHWIIETFCYSLEHVQWKVFLLSINALKEFMKFLSLSHLHGNSTGMHHCSPQLHHNHMLTNSRQTLYHFSYSLLACMREKEVGYLVTLIVALWTSIVLCDQNPHFVLSMHAYSELHY